MEISYYLPEILFGVMAVVAVVWIGRVIWALFLGTKGKTACIHCKGTAEKEEGFSCLFLIPVHFGEVYGDAERYLQTHMTPIKSKEQIPTGMRACRLEVYRCRTCDKRQVEITDFLDVRGEETVKGQYEFSYESFAGLIEQWKELSWASQAKRYSAGQVHGESVSIMKRKGEL